MRETPAATPLPQAGWYPDPEGNIRWWDGYNWGVYASTPPSHEPATRLTTAALVIGIFAALAAVTGFLMLGPFLSMFLAFVPGVLAVTIGAIAFSKAKKARSSTLRAGAGLGMGAASLLLGPLLFFSM